MTRRSLALVLVRNTVTHDARVLREAEVLRGLGFDVLVAGVGSEAEPAGAGEVAGFRVVRLDPAGAIRRVLGLAGRARSPVPGDGPSAPGAPATPAGGGVRATARRLAVTCAYHVQGMALVWRHAPALVHANDYNTMWIGIAAKLLRGSRLIYDCHELWADRNGRPEWRHWLLACEALFVRVADRTITTSPGYADEIAARYRVVPPQVVRNIPATPASVTRADASAASGAPLAVYVGGLMPGRGLEQAIDALTLAPEMRLRLVGPGRSEYRAGLVHRSDVAGVAERVHFMAPVPPRDVVDALEGADMGLMLIQPICRSYELTLPNKLFEYAAAGLPIVASDLPVIGDVVSRHGLGAVVPAAEVERIAEAMRALCEPRSNAAARERVREFARRATWGQEKRLLERVYDPAHESRDVADVYRRYRASPRKRRSWSAANPGNIAIRRELTDAVFDLAGSELRGASAILDIGCGAGWWLERLAGDPRVTARLHGIELLDHRVAAARSRVTAAEIRGGDARALPYPDGRFDVAFLFTVLSSLPAARDVELALLEAGRVLAPGGALLVWEPRIPNPFNRSTLFVGDQLMRSALRVPTLAAHTITVFPPLARRLGVTAPRLYPLLARVAMLRTHRIVCVR